MDSVWREELEKVLPKPPQCPDPLYFTMRQCCQLEPEARISPRDMVKDIRAVSLRGKLDIPSEPCQAKTGLTVFVIIIFITKEGLTSTSPATSSFGITLTTALCSVTFIN